MHVSVRRSGPFLFLLGLMLAWFASSAVAQGTSGKIQGRVVDAESGNPVAGAQVVVLGTRLGNLSDPQGYYFINNVPAGLYNIQAQYIGYQTTTVQGQRVNAGYTTTVNFRLSLQAVAIEAITVQGESAPITPRDKTVSGNVVTGDVVSQLPVDNMNQVVALTPGVINYGGQFVIRGGRAGEASVYIDGVLVRNFNSGDQGRIQLGTNAVEEVNVLTGGFGAEFGQAQSGVVSYVTKSGGTRYTGSLAVQSDAMMPNSIRYGQTRLEANVGGPIIPSRLSFNVALAAEGAVDAGRRFLNMAGADSLPVEKHFFEPIGLATVPGAPDSVKYMQYKSLGDMGNRLPWNNADNYTANATLRFDPTKSTKLTFGGITNRAQGLGFSYYRQFIPGTTSGYRNTSDLVRLGLEQILFQSAERQAVLRLNGAYQNDVTRSGQLADTAALTPAGPDFMGFRFSPYKFFFDGKFTMDRYLARFDSVKNGIPNAQGIVPDVLTGVETLDCGGTSCPVSFGDRFFNAVESSDIPTGFTNSNLAGRGLSGWGYTGEKTYSLNGALDLQANRLHRLGAGFEVYKKTVDNLSAGISSTYFHNVYRVKPTIAGAYIKDRMDIGEMVLDVGARFDYYSSDAKFPQIPGLVLPFEPDSPDSPLCASAPDASGKCQPNFIKQDAIWSWSPRLGVAFPISTSTNFRLSYGHFFQLPAFNLLYNGINTDLSRSNTNTTYGRPIDPMKTVQFEVGVTHFFNPFTVLDVTAYDKSKLADATYRIQNYTMPKSQHGNQDLRVLTGLDYGSNRGADLRLTRRYGRYFTAILGYSYLDAKGTGSDPYSYTSTFGRFGDAFGHALLPAQAIQTNDFDQTHRFTVAATADFGKDIGEGTVWNPILKATTLAMTMTAGSGLPYTTTLNFGARGRRPYGSDPKFNELLNASRLPWTYNIDGRLSRGVNIGSQKIAVFADVRNLLNSRFITNVFGANGSPVDPGDIAGNAAFTGPTVTISTTTDPQAKLAFQRQKDYLASYGLADMSQPDVLTHDEQVKARALQYIQSWWLPDNFSAPRRIQLGAEWVF